MFRIMYYTAKLRVTYDKDITVILRAYVKKSVE